MKFKLRIHANWGTSRPYEIACKDESDLMRKFEDTGLLGDGNIVSVYALKDEKIIALKAYRKY